MNISKAIELGKQENWIDACSRVNPSDSKQWYIMLTDRDKKSYILVNDDEVPLTSEDLNSFVPILKEVGLKAFSVIF